MDRIYEVKSGAGTMQFPFKTYFSKYLLDIYSNFNQKEFDKNPYIPKYFKKCNRIIYTFHNQNIGKVKTFKLKKCVIPNNDKDIVVGFSGGLDSCYQALHLKKKGYNVHLLFVKNINYYEGGQALKAARVFANKHNFDLIEICFSINTSKDNKYKKVYAENSFKNQLILGIMIDYCIAMGYTKVSLGDAFSLSIKDAIAGLCGTDAREITQSFLKFIKHYVNIKFVPIKKGTTKDKRLKLLNKNKDLNFYYSCVSPGRFNALWHNNNEKKYGIKLPKYNCGNCMKCCYHWLVLAKLGIVKRNKQFEEHCWDKLSYTKYGTKKALFNKNIPIEQRIANLNRYGA